MNKTGILFPHQLFARNPLESKYSFVFGWFKTKTQQFWSVPFVSEEKRKGYLKKVVKDVEKDIKG